MYYGFFLQLEFQFVLKKESAAINMPVELEQPKSLNSVNMLIFTQYKF